MVLRKKIDKVCLVIFILAVIFYIFLVNRNIIKKYDSELQNILGDYKAESLGYFNENGYEGLGHYKYKKWKVIFKDAYNNEVTAFIRNDKDFKSQMLFISNYVFEKNIITETLNEYLDGDFSDFSNNGINDKNHVPETPYISYKTKDGFYDAMKNNTLLISFDIDYESLSKYNLYSTKNETLINDKKVSIDHIIYEQNRDHIISDDLQKEKEINELITITKSINSLIPIRAAYYSLNESTGYKRYDLNFK